MSGLSYRTNQKLSPMMEQWYKCKEKAKDALLLFRLGDFYESFYEDAYVISKELEVTLTQRQKLPMCGVPWHTCEAYVDKLLNKGFKVAIAEQMEDPKSVKGIVKREVVRILTPGTVISSSTLSDKSNNFFVSLSQVGKIFGISIIDLSTSEFRVMELDSPKALFDELLRIKPKELLLSNKYQKNNSQLLEDLSYHFQFITNV